VPRRECRSEERSDQHGERCDAQGSRSRSGLLATWGRLCRTTLRTTTSLFRRRWPSTRCLGQAAAPIPLIGARLNDKDSTVLLQLSYTSEGNWSRTLHKVEFLVKPSGDVGNWKPNTAIRVTVQKIILLMKGLCTLMGE
ncbi:trans-sialidase, partial [Trypanosoma cruzi]